MKISKRCDLIEPSLTRQLFNMALKYDDVINLTLGDPDLLPNIDIRNAACDSILSGKTRYSANAGLLELRKVIKDHIKKEYKLDCDPETELIVTVGGMEGLFLTLQTLLDDGDEVIIPGPYYVNYVQMVRMSGGVPVIVNTKEENEFSFTIEDIKKVVTDKTRIIMLNTPSNPSGQVLSYDLLKEVSTLVKEKNLTVIADEVYSSLIFDGNVHHSILEFPDMKDHTILIDSISKRFSMTGYRIGYAFGPNEVIKNMIKMQENVCACAPLPSQYAAIKAYRDIGKDESSLKIFEERRNVIYDGLSKIKGLTMVKPKATFYMMINISKTGMDSMTFATKLLEKAHISVAPGLSYGKEYDKYIRIAFTLDKEILKEAVKRIEKFMNEL